jgi:hypothetical protein
MTVRNVTGPTVIDRADAAFGVEGAIAGGDGFGVSTQLGATRGGAERLHATQVTSAPIARWARGVIGTFVARAMAFVRGRWRLIRLDMRSRRVDDAAPMRSPVRRRLRIEHAVIVVAMQAALLLALTRCEPPPAEPLVPPAPPVQTVDGSIPEALLPLPVNPAPPAPASASSLAQIIGADAAAALLVENDAAARPDGAHPRSGPSCGVAAKSRKVWRNEADPKWQSALHGYTSRALLAQRRALGSAGVPFATYLNHAHNRIHPLWADTYLEWLRTLPCDDPRNDFHRFTTLEVTVAGSDGHIVDIGVVVSSGIESFDLAAITAVVRAAPLDVAPTPLESWDGNVYFQWELHRDEAFACATVNVRPFLLNAPPTP